jgi:dynein heavy chain
MEDLDTCIKQLPPILEDYDKIPFDVLNYLGSIINYGGRVIDDKDKRLIETIL